MLRSLRIPPLSRRLSLRSHLLNAFTLVYILWMHVHELHSIKWNIGRWWGNTKDITTLPLNAQHKSHCSFTGHKAILWINSADCILPASCLYMATLLGESDQNCTAMCVVKPISVCCAHTHIWSWNDRDNWNQFTCRAKTHTVRSILHVHIFSESFEKSSPVIDWSCAWVVTSTLWFIICMKSISPVSYATATYLHEISNCHYLTSTTTSMNLCPVRTTREIPKWRSQLVSENGGGRFYRTLLPHIDNYLSFGTAFTRRGLRRTLWAFFSNLVIWIIGS